MLMLRKAENGVCRHLQLGKRCVKKTHFPKIGSLSVDRVCQTTLETFISRERSERNTYVGY